MHGIEGGGLLPVHTIEQNTSHVSKSYHMLLYAAATEDEM
jgi:hypothetical protein